MSAEDQQRILAEAQSLARFGCFEWEIATDSLRWTPEMFQIFGIQPADFPGTAAGFLKQVHPEDRERVADVLAQAVQARRDYQLTERIVRPDGTVRILESRGHLCLDALGEPVRVIGVCRDVTEERATDQQLHQQMIGWRLLAKSAVELLAASKDEAAWEPPLTNLAAYLQCDHVGLYLWEPLPGDALDDCPTNEPVLTRIAGSPFPEWLCRAGLQSDSLAAWPGPGGAVASGHSPDRAVADQSFDWPPTSEVAYACPLRGQGGLLGVLCLSGSRRDGIAPAERDFLQAIASLLSAALATRRATRQVAASEARFRCLVEQAHDAFLLTTLDGKIVDVNQQACTALGYAREELLRLHIQDIDPFTSPGAIQDSTRLLLDRGTIRLDATHRRRDGTLFPAEINISRLDIDGRPYALALARDVSERRRIESAILEREQRFRLLAEHARIVVWEADPSTATFTYVSDFCEQFLGYTAADWKQPGFWAGKIHPDDAGNVLGAIAQALTVPRNHGLEYRMVHADGSIVWVEDRIKCVVEEGRVVAIHGAFIDITVRKQLEEQFRQSQKMDAVGRLAGGIAHDFNNLLTVINSYSDLLLLKIGATDPLGESVRAIQDAGQRAARLTAQLLMFSRLSLTVLRPVHLNETIRKIEPLLQRFLAPRIDLQLDLDDRLPTILADSNHLDQIILNLTINARDAIPTSGSVRISTQYLQLPTSEQTLTGELPAGDYVRLNVVDTGCGIPEDVRPRIFEPFFTTKAAGSGTGLGLSVVYGVVQQSYGQINVTSRAGVGTNISIFLPIAAAAVPVTPMVQQDPSRGGFETLLLVEQDAAVRQVTKTMLQMHGYRVLEACSGEEAVRLLVPTGDIALVIADRYLPDMTAEQFLSAAERLLPKPRLLLLDGASVPAAQSALPPHLPVLKKPFSVVTLLREVRQVITGAPQPRTSPRGLVNPD